MAAEDGDDASNPSSPLPRSPSRHPLSSPVSCRKKSGDLPGISDCHRCGLHFPPESLLDKLQILHSQWRAVLLCNPCFFLVLSAKACSYCFSMITTDGDRERLLDCCLCSRRVHLRCEAAERGYMFLPDLHPDSFTCIDCCPLVVSGRRKPRCPNPNVSLEKLVKDAKATAERKQAAVVLAREKALQKAAAARDAARRARTALDAVSVAMHPVPSAVSDKELALQLHLAMNGSQRILRSHFSTKKAQKRSDCGGKAESKNYHVCGKVGFPTEDKDFLEAADEIWLNRLSLIRKYYSEEDQKKELEDGSCNQSLPIEVEPNISKDRKSGSNVDTGSGLVEIPVNPEEADVDHSSSIECPNEKTCQVTVNIGCDGSIMSEVPIEEGQRNCGQNSSTEVNSDEQKGQTTRTDGDCKTYLVEVPVEEGEHINYSSSIRSDSDEEDCTEGIEEYIDSNLVEVLVEEERDIRKMSSFQLCSSNGKDQMKGVNEYHENNLVDVPVREEQGTCNQSSSLKIYFNDIDRMKGIDWYNESNLIDVPVKEELGSCPNNIGSIAVSCKRSNQLNGTTVLLECGGSAQKESSESLVKRKRCGAPNCYAKKYRIRTRA